MGSEYTCSLTQWAREQAANDPEFKKLYEDEELRLQAKLSVLEFFENRLDPDDPGSVALVQRIRADIDGSQPFGAPAAP